MLRAATGRLAKVGFLVVFAVFWTGIVRDRAKAVKFQFADRGEHAVKGYKDPIPVYEVLWDEGRATGGREGEQQGGVGSVADAAE